jgi:hypothetical protein
VFLPWSWYKLLWKQVLYLKDVLVVECQNEMSCLQMQHKKAPYGAYIPNNSALEVLKEKEGVFIAFSALQAF